MPIYEYSCAGCGQTFAHLWRSIQAANDAPAPACPACASPETRRVLSPVAVLGGMGGLTPGEQAAASAQATRQASITPKAQIDSLRQSKAGKDAP